MQSGKAVWPWVLGVVVIGGAGGWLFRDQLKSLADGVRLPAQFNPCQYQCTGTTASGRRARASTTIDQASAGYRGRRRPGAAETG